MDTVKAVSSRYVTIQRPTGATQRYTWAGMERAAARNKLYARLLSQARQILNA